MRFEYDERSAGTKVSFIMADKGRMLDIGPRRLTGGTRPEEIRSPEYVLDYPDSINNLKVLRNVVEAMLKQLTGDER